MNNFEMQEGDLKASFSVKTDGQYVMLTGLTEVDNDPMNKFSFFMGKENFSKFVDFLNMNRSSND